MTTEDTVPLPLLDISGDDVEEVAERLTKTTFVRSVIVAFLALVGAVVGREVGAEWLDPFIDLYSLTVVPALAWWLHRKTEVSKPSGKHAK